MTVNDVFREVSFITTRGGLLEFGEKHIIFGDKKAGTQHFLLLTGGGTEDFHKKILTFVLFGYRNLSKLYFLDIWIIMKNFLAVSRQRTNISIFS